MRKAAIQMLRAETPMRKGQARTQQLAIKTAKSSSSWLSRSQPQDLVVVLQRLVEEGRIFGWATPGNRLSLVHVLHLSLHSHTH